MVYRIKKEGSMKSIKLLVLTIALVVCSQSVGAIQTPSVEAHRAINKDAAEQFQQSDNGKLASSIDTITELGKRYLTNLRTCEPIHYNQYLDLFGLKISLSADVNGWVDNKCQYAFSANIGGVGKDIRDLYDVKFTDEALAKVKPEIVCNFDQDQLNILVDALVSRQMQSIEQYKKMLENPAEKYVVSTKKNMTPEEEVALAMLMGSSVCKVVNKEELMNNFSELMMLYSAPSEEPKELTPVQSEETK